MKMTYKQSWTLHTFTRRDWRTLNPAPEMEEASKIISLCIEVFVHKDKSKANELTALIQKWFPDWTMAENRYIPRKKEEHHTPRYDEGKEKEDQKQGEEESRERDQQQEHNRNMEAEKREREEKIRKEAEEIKAKREAERQEKEEAEKKAKEEKESKELTTPRGYVKPSIYDLAKTLVMNRENICLVGPAGCGKSRLAEELALDLKKDFFTISFAGGLRYAQVFGSTQIENGTSRFVPGPLLEAIQRPGIVLLDETMSADPDVSLGLNSLTERNTRYILTPIGKIKMHEECTFIACSNTTGRVNSRQYTGTQRADDSFISRFAFVLMEYDERLEKILCHNVCNSHSVDLIKAVKKLREKVRLNNIPYDASTRSLLQAARMVKLGISLKDSLDVAFLNVLSPTEREKIGGLA